MQPCNLFQETKTAVTFIIKDNNLALLGLDWLQDFALLNMSFNAVYKIINKRLSEPSTMLIKKKNEDCAYTPTFT